MKHYTVEDLWLVVLRQDNGDQFSRIWVAPSDRTGLRRIYRAAVPGLFPVTAVPITHVFATRLQPQASGIQRVLRGKWFVALVQGAGDVPEIAQVQAKNTDLAISTLQAQNQEMRALLSQDEVLANTAQARAVLSGQALPDRDLVENPPTHVSNPRLTPGEIEKIQRRDRDDVWSRVRK